ncbi:hypothetical protein [Azospirillum palustre]
MCCVTTPSSPVTSTNTRHFIAPPDRCQGAPYHPSPRFATVLTGEAERTMRKAKWAAQLADADPLTAGDEDLAA